MQATHFSRSEGPPSERTCLRSSSFLGSDIARYFAPGSWGFQDNPVTKQELRNESRTSLARHLRLLHHRVNSAADEQSTTSIRLREGERGALGTSPTSTPLASSMPSAHCRHSQTATGIVTSAAFLGNGRFARWLSAISAATSNESSR